MPKESLSASMPKLILAVVLIVCIGAVMGLMGYALTKKQTRVKAPKVKTPNEIVEEKKEEFKIIYPTRDTIWRIGETYKIQWQPSNPNNKVVIKLYKVPVVSLNLKWEPSSSVPNTGYYSFTVFEGLETGEYQFVIIEDDQISRSEEFMITSEEVEKGETPEEVVENFYNWYIKNVRLRMDGGNALSYKDNRYVSNELIQSVNRTVASFGDGPGYDCIMCAQDLPWEIAVNKAEISGKNAKVILKRRWGKEIPEGAGVWNNTEVNLKLIDGEWKITGVVCL